MRGEARWAIALFLIATSLASTFVLIRAPDTYRSLHEEPRTAAHIAQGHGFASPIDPSPDAEPTNWPPPVYPYLMAGAYLVFGLETPAALNAMLLLNALCFGLLVSGAFVLGREAFGRDAGILAAIGVLSHPLFLLRTPFYWDTYPALAMFTWLLIAAIRAERRGGTPIQLAGLGAALGVLALTNTSYLFIAPVLVLMVVRRRTWTSKAELAAVSLLAFALVLGPWSLRNYSVFGEWMVVRGGLYLEAWLGNQPGRSGWVDVENHPYVNPDEGRRFIEIGEQAYGKLSRQRFWDDYLADPNAFWARTFRRAGYLFVGPVGGDAIRLVRLGPKASLARIGSDILLALLAGVGLVVARRGNPLAPWLLAVGLAAVVPFLLTHVAYRYLMPLKLILVVLAAAGVAESVAAWASSRGAKRRVA